MKRVDYREVSYETTQQMRWIIINPQQSVVRKFTHLLIISWDGVMVTCKAHNLETEMLSVGSIPTPATN